MSDDDWLEQAMRGFQDAITKGAYEGIYALEEPARDRVLESQAGACVHAFVELFGISKDLTLDEFLEKMRYGGSSKVEITREGDSILWDEQHEGQCMCPLVKRDVVPLGPELCGCAVHWLRMLVQRHTEAQVGVELLSSVATGSRNCTFRIRLGNNP
jgi:hypothetical protein